MSLIGAIDETARKLTDIFAKDNKMRVIADIDGYVDPLVITPKNYLIPLHTGSGFSASSSRTITQTAEIEAGALSTIKFSATVDGTLQAGDVVMVSGSSGAKMLLSRTDATHWVVDSAYSGAVAAGAAVAVYYSAWQEMPLYSASDIYVVSLLTSGAWSAGGSNDTVNLQFSMDGFFPLGSTVTDILAGSAIGTYQTTEVDSAIQKLCPYFRYYYEELGSGSPVSKVWLVGVKSQVE